MRFAILVIACLLGAFVAQAQSLTGIWRGYFYSGLGLFQQRYKFEVQINELRNHGLRGVTYSYSTTSFYGKAGLKGIYRNGAQTLVIKEDTLLEVRGSSGSTCLMTCYLDYAKSGNTETLTGTFTSVVAGSSADCGRGNVYLERVEESDFRKEDFLTQKPPSRRPVTPTPKPAPPVIFKPKKDTSSAIAKAEPEVLIPPVKKDTQLPAPPAPVPPALKERKNDLVKTIVTHSPDIKIDIYDNGEIDGDTVTVYHNNQTVALRKGLSQKPITLTVKASRDNNIHEFVMYANNLGKIPPNTALMVVTTGGKRYELSVMSNKEKNAKVVIRYEPEEE